MVRGNGSTEALAARVREWIAADPDPETRAEAEALLRATLEGDAAAAEQLRDAFEGRLAFGTAGLRAERGAGPRRMNRVVVAQTSAGFAAYLQQRAARGQAADPPSVVIGYDARVNSEVFAREAAEILAGAGLRVTLLPHPTPTPVTAFAVRHLGVSAGVMVTASHNPPRDNGYKVYLGDADGGSQITPPVDGEIAELIAEVAAAPIAGIPRSTAYTVAGTEIERAYVQQTAAAVRTAPAPQPGARSLTVVYTAMHGVGGETTRQVLAAAGLPEVIPVPEQQEPDARFPTLAYPNPEEPGALELAYRTGREHQAQLIVAHDPDADRLAIAAPHPDETDGFRRLSGNELGLLLGWRAAERERAAAEREGRAPRGALANTIVSSPALGAVARAYGLTHVETLSGFKWVSRVPELLFGYEESLGYLSTPGVLHDKDGISAAGEALAMARELHAAGRTVWDRLAEASERFGHYASTQVVLRLGSNREAARLTGRMRQAPPAAFGGVPVRHHRDLSRPGAAAAPADVLAYDLEDGSRVMVRPSGTEPKLKVYLDACCTSGSAAERRTAAEGALAPIERAVRAYLEEVRS